MMLEIIKDKRENVYKEEIGEISNRALAYFVHIICVSRKISSMGILSAHTFSDPH